MADHESPSYQDRPGPSVGVDEKIAAIVHLQQIQKKQEMVQLMESHTVSNADAGFRRGLEELVRDHLSTCMAIASCSSPVHDSGMGGPSGSSNLSENAHDSLGENQDSLDAYDSIQTHSSDVSLFEMNNSSYCDILDHGQHSYDHQSDSQLVPEQRANEIHHSSPHERPRSRILSVWAAQQAQEMITTMERQTREAELLALAGLHVVSTLDASFLRESLEREQSSMGRESLETQQSSIVMEARQQRRRSSLVQMWRELEEERRNQTTRTSSDGRVSVPTESQNFESVSSQQPDMVLSGPTQQVENMQEMLQSEEAADMQEMLQPDDSVFPDWEQNGSDTVHAHPPTEDSEINSTQVQEGEREHVRQIVQRLMTDSVPNSVQAQNRSIWLDENERERVRELAREWIRVTNEQRSAPQGREAINRNDLINSARAGEPQTTGLSRRQRRFLNRQVILDMLMRAERERQRELQHLVEHRAVSDFAHRNRLQSFLRGRFLRTGATSDEERIPSSAEGELGQLRQRRAVSNLREGFRFRLESILQSQANNRLNSEHALSPGPQRRRRRENLSAAQSFESRNQIARDGPLGDNLSTNSAQRSPFRRGGLSGESPSTQASRGPRRANTGRRVSDIQTLEESTAYNMELQELLGRRSVTNVLASEFRDRLDQLIQSFLQTQGRPPVGWGLTQTVQAGTTPRQPRRQQQQQRQPRQQPPWTQQVQNNHPNVIPPPPPPPPPQPLWQQEIQPAPWSRPAVSIQRPSLLEVEGINDLRGEVSKLQQGMTDLQRLMETCMEMQLDLQRSIRQEVAGALQRMYDGKAVPEEAIDGSKWVSVKHGICCVCCDRNIDSLLYRCGHMCTCLKCASELVRNSGKCPMCRAPIMEVVRAFTVV